MKKNIFILLFLQTFLFADVAMRYHVNVGMFGQVGYSDFTLKEDNDRYVATTTAIMVGIAATLTGNWVETFTSSGKKINGRYIPESFIKTKSRTGRYRIQTYTFDHVNKKVHMHQKKTKTISKSKFNTSDFKICYEDVNKTTTKESTLDLYLPDDAITNYLNTKIYCNADKKHHTILAVGAHNDENNVTLSYLYGEKKELAKLNFSENVTDIYNIHVEPFNEDDEIVDVLVANGTDGYMQEALMGEIFWIGKITANRVDHNFTKQSGTE